MFNKITLLSCLVFIAVNSTISLAQNKAIELNKNPFSQPDFLKYRPPVKLLPEKQNSPEEIPDFILTATFISVNGSMAIVNNNLLSVGEEVDGIDLVMVDEGMVRIRFKGKLYEILISEPEIIRTQKIKRNGVQ